MNIYRLNLLISCSILMLSCTSFNDVSKTRGAPRPDTETLTLPNSYLAKKKAPNSLEHSSEPQANAAPSSRTYYPIKSLASSDAPPARVQRLTAGFSDEPEITVSTDGLTPIQFVHYVFGDLLNLNYIVDEELRNKSGTLTLNISERLSPKRLMELSIELLENNDVRIFSNDDVYFLKVGATQENTIIGIGRRVEDVPNTTRGVLQIVPVTFGTRISTERTINQLLDIQIIPDSDQNAFFLRGSRETVIRAVELINLLDTPANRGRHIGLVELTYIDPDTLMDRLITLLATEGIEAGSATDRPLKNIALVPLKRIGATAVFATSELLVERVKYWVSLLDKPTRGAEKQYFTFTPKNARASDIFESISRLIAGTIPTNIETITRQNAASSNPLTNQRMQTGVAPTAQRAMAVNTTDINIVVDELSNSLIFYCKGAEYQSIRTLLEKLDTLPKQVLLDILIAEVTLQDEFRLGIEWAFRSNGINYTTQGAFGATSFAGIALGIEEDAGALNATALATNSLVNVISNPTLLVRDGTSANINVGSDIAVIGNTTIDPIIGQRQTVATEYRKTGVDITVTPTINTSDVIIMEISQTISNTVPGSAGAAGNPDIFERALETQVVARSGQTILLGGLISEDKNSSNKGIPFLKDIPVIGNLGKGRSETSQKTELIMMITARVLDNPDEWAEIRNSLAKGFKNLEVMPR